MARSRRRDGEQRRDEILDAALRCFERDGVFGARIEAIRREAKASPSSVYNLFANIEEIMLALLVRVFESLFLHIATRVRRTRTAEGAVRSLVDAHIEWIAARPSEGRFMYQAMVLERGGLRSQARRQLGEAKSRALQPVVAHFEGFIGRGELPRWSPTMFDVVLLGVAHEALRRWLAGSIELAPERLRKTLPDLAWKSLL